MRYDSFPLDTQVMSEVYDEIPTPIVFLSKASGVSCFISDLQVPSGFLLLWHDQNVVHPVKQSARVGQKYLQTLIPSSIYSSLVLPLQNISIKRNVVDTTFKSR